LNACSFDKGFHSPANQVALTEQLDMVALPRKGKLSQQAQAVEQSDAFINARRKHSAVESAINALEVHGLIGVRITVSTASSVTLHWLCWQETFTALATF